MIQYKILALLYVLVHASNTLDEVPKSCRFPRAPGKIRPGLMLFLFARPLRKEAGVPRASLVCLAIKSCTETENYFRVSPSALASCRSRPPPGSVPFAWTIDPRSTSWFRPTRGPECTGHQSTEVLCVIRLTVTFVHRENPVIERGRSGIAPEGWTGGLSVAGATPLS